MSHTAQTPKRSSFPAIVAILGAFLIFYFLLNSTYLKSDDTAAEMPAPEWSSLEERQGADATLLNNYKVIDAANGKVRLDIERAKELVIAESAN